MHDMPSYISILQWAGFMKQCMLQALALEGRLISRKLQQLQRISISAADLVVKMLKIKPAQRITAPEAVRHEYILGDAL